MPSFELLEVVDVVLPVQKGVSLYSQFTSFMFDNYKHPNDPEHLSPEVRSKCFRVSGEGHPYHFVVDFQQLIPLIKEQSAIGDVQLIYTYPHYLSLERLHQDARRSMRTLTKNDVWTNQDGSLLVHEEILATLERLHSHATAYFPIDENTPRDGRNLLIFDETTKDQSGQVYCQVARWIDGAWRYQHDEYTINGTHFRFL